MGGNFTVSRFVNYFARNLDNVLIAKVWGDGPVALYSKAYSLLILPLNQMATPIGQVAVPALSKLHADEEQYRSFFFKGVSMASFLMAPVCLFTIIASREIILAFLGPDWAESIPIFFALAPKLLFTTTSTCVNWVVFSKGYTGKHLKTTVFASFVILATFLSTIWFGVLVLAWAFTVISISLRIPLSAYLLKDSPVSLRDILAIQVSSLLSATVAAIATFILGRFLLELNPAASLFIQAFVFGLLYLALTWTSEGAELLRAQAIQLLKAR